MIRDLVMGQFVANKLDLGHTCIGSFTVGSPISLATGVASAGLTYLNAKNYFTNEDANTDGFLVLAKTDYIVKTEYWSGSAWVEFSIDQKNIILGSTNKLLTGTDTTGNTILTSQIRITRLLTTTGVIDTVRLGAVNVDTTANTAIAINTCGYVKYSML